MKKELVIQRLKEIATHNEKNSEFFLYHYRNHSEDWPIICMDCGLIDKEGETVKCEVCERCDSTTLWSQWDFIKHIVKEYIGTP